MENSTSIKIAKRDLPKLESLYMTKFRKHKAYVLFCAEGFKFSNNSRMFIGSNQQCIRDAIKKLTAISYEEALEIEKNASIAQIELQNLNYLIPKLERTFRHINNIDWTGKKKPTRAELHASIIAYQDEHDFLVRNCILDEPRLGLFDLRWLMKKVSSLASERLGNGEVKYTVGLSKHAYCTGNKAQKEFIIVGNHELFSFLNISVEYKEA